MKLYLTRQEKRKGADGTGSIWSLILHIPVLNAEFNHRVHYTHENTAALSNRRDLQGEDNWTDIPQT